MAVVIKMAQRYGYNDSGKKWGIQPSGQYASAWILARETGMNNNGFGLHDSASYLQGVEYGVSSRRFMQSGIDDAPIGLSWSKDSNGNYYMDPQGKYQKVSPHLDQAQRIAKVQVQDLSAFGG